MAESVGRVYHASQANTLDQTSLVEAIKSINKFNNLKRSIIDLLENTFQTGVHPRNAENVGRVNHRVDTYMYMYFGSDSFGLKYANTLAFFLISYIFIS